jgi:hypothetical protein
LSISPGLNLPGQETYLSFGARVRKPPSPMVWHLILESVVEGTTTLPDDAFCR